MANFKVTWSTGKVEEFEQSEAETVEQFTNIHFGSAWEGAAESGVTVELVGAETTAEDGDAPAAPAKRGRKAAAAAE